MLVGSEFNKTCDISLEYDINQMCDAYLWASQTYILRMNSTTCEIHVTFNQSNTT